VAQADAEPVRITLAQAAANSEWGEIVVDSAIAKVSIVGAGMISHPGVALMFEALAQHLINIQMIATSEIKISCVVAKSTALPLCYSPLLGLLVAKNSSSGLTRGYDKRAGEQRTEEQGEEESSSGRGAGEKLNSISCLP